MYYNEIWLNATNPRSRYDIDILSSIATRKGADRRSNLKYITGTPDVHLEHYLSRDVLQITFNMQLNLAWS